ncbi:MAG: methyltransferase domain-containing protein [Ktedonobacterales bacterium]
MALHPPLAAARVLELGCGVGIFTRALLTALPQATLLATDTDDALLSRARVELATEVRAGQVRFERADANRLPYAARDFDLVACRCLLMHQPDPLVTVAEMFRVTTLGGVALAIEPDWGARALYPDAEALDETLALARRARPFGFPDVLLGRKLFALLRAAGFVEIGVQSTAFSLTAHERNAPTAGAAAPLGPGRLLEQARSLLLAARLIERAALDDLIARLDAATRHPEYFSAGVDFAAVAIKPAPTPF